MKQSEDDSWLGKTEFIAHRRSLRYCWVIPAHAKKKGNTIYQNPGMLLYWTLIQVSSVYPEPAMRLKDSPIIEQ